MDARTFLSTIFGDNEGYLFIGTLDDQKRLNDYKSFKYPESLNSVVKYIELREDEDVYFSPMLYAVPRRSSKTVSVTPVVYADTDSFNPDDYKIRPSINLDTSPGKTHSFWLLDDIYTPDEVKEAARAVALTEAKKVNGKQAGVDPSGWDFTQMLRVPGTTNTNPRNKPGFDSFRVEVSANSPGEVYSLAEIIAEYDPANLPVMPLAADTPMPDELPAAKDVLRKIAADAKLSSFYSTVPHGDWSDTLYAFISEMFRKGFSPEEALVGAWNSSCNKYKRDDRPIEHLWQYDVLKAQADPDNKPRPIIEREPDADPEHPKEEGVVVAELQHKLLSDAEAELLTETFVDRYVKWAASKTDAPAPYHVASAFTILSCVLGEWGVAYPQFGDLRLGLFFVIMGETTRTRKSTARNLMKRVLRMVQVGDYKYILTSDVTPETLIDRLADRPHQSSLYDRDEAQQLIHDVKHKGYLAGFFETLNELYDGWAHGRDRVGKSTEDTPVNFVQYLMGIRSQIQDNLEIHDFTSGWGPRNIFVRGDAPPRTKAASRLRQGSLEDGVDKEFMQIVMSLTKARDFWAKTVGNRHAPMRILFEDDAWERWNDFAWELGQYVENHPRAEMLLPSVERLGFNVIKVAVLLAMYAQRTTVTMGDLINAIYYSMQWVEDLIIVAEGVSESLRAAELAKLEKFIIDKGGLVSFATALKWSIGQGKSRKDFLDMVDTMIDSDTLQIVEAGTKQVKSLELLDG